MGFDVHVVVSLPKPPGHPVMTALADKFEEATHEAGTKLVTILEHVSVADEADAIAFVRSLVMDAVPQGSTITDISATPA
jgi:urease gamma subunit